MPTQSSQNRRLGLVAYWNETSRPLVSLFFVLPMLAVYEGGLLMFGADVVVRNGADDWLRRFLSLLGFGQYLLLPLLTCGILLGWHHVTRDRWRVRWPVMTGMYLEAALFGFVLLVLAQLQGRFLQSTFMQTAAESDAASRAASELAGTGGEMIGFLGAGIYEELLFRLMLLPAIAFLLRGVGLAPKSSWVLAVVASSVLFSAAHFQLFVGSGEGFAWFPFVFRATAGIYFSLIFLLRGFGIAAGAHAFYDVLARMSSG